MTSIRKSLYNAIISPNCHTIYTHRKLREGVKKPIECVIMIIPSRGKGPGVLITPS